MVEVRASGDLPLNYLMIAEGTIEPEIVAAPVREPFSAAYENGQEAPEAAEPAIAQMVAPAAPVHR